MQPHLTLSPDAPIDLHMHTTYSDGRWSAAELIEHVASAGFALIAVTDHDRVDMIASIQTLGEQRNLPVLAGVEMSTSWRGRMGDLLCYGFDPRQNELQPLAEKVVRLQLENTRAVHEVLLQQGHTFPRQAEILAKTGGQLRRPGDNIALLRAHGYAADYASALSMITQAGYRSIKVEMAEAVEATHRSGGVCLIAHPGRRESSFTFYTPELLDEVRADLPLDGIEVYHPTHTPEIVETYLAYARQHQLLQSTGSDSHGNPSRMPIKHRAEISRDLLARVGIQVE
ncbi:MAG TPA: PHP domain-containing protein [Ktedonobacteraceae bacterium]|nr:PHP domain-containing protein [Ktedonobacteraceae bacterium]